MTMKTHTVNKARSLYVVLTLAGLIYFPFTQSAASKGTDVADLLSQAAMHQSKGRVNLAQNTFKQALAKAQAAGDLRTEAIVKNNLASLWILASL